ncbi:MAG TPA: tetratricopeptide repeat protein, partial [Cyclobacteriaceae bacterium]
MYKPDSGITIANQTLRLATDQKLKYEIGYSQYILSKANWAKANYRLSTQHGFEALKIFENSIYIDEWVNCLLSLARTFIDLRNTTVAREFLTKAISVAHKSSNTNTPADIYREFSLLLLNQHQYDSALLYCDKALVIYEKEKDTLTTSIVYGRKARIYYELKDYTRSLYYNKKSLILDKLVNNRRALGVSYFIAAQIADKTNKQDSAIYFLTKSLKLNEAVGNIGTLIKSHELMADIYIQKGKPDIATSELKLVSQLKDTLYNLEKNGQIQEMQSIYELETKDKTIKLLEQENVITNQRRASDRLLLIYLLICIALLSALILVFWRIRIIQ